MVAISLVALAGCASADRPLGDSEQIVRSVLRLLASDGKPVCLDDHTQKDPLAVFREMRLAPQASRAQLHWYAPMPLRPERPMTTGELRNGEFNDAQNVRREPGARPNPLPQFRQFLLAGAARRLSVSVADVQEPTAIRSSWAPPGVTTRWWPLNRLRRDCAPLFIVSDPVHDRHIGFVAVHAEHWGTLYAVERVNGRWAPTAEWSRWLY